MYWMRKVVPRELRPLIGKRELKRSLATRDPNEAKRLAQSVSAKFKCTIGQARDGLLMDSETLQGLAGKAPATAQTEQAQREHEGTSGGAAAAATATTTRGRGTA